MFAMVEAGFEQLLVQAKGKVKGSVYRQARPTMRKTMAKLPTDLEILDDIYNGYYDDFRAYSNENKIRETKIYIYRYRNNCEENGSR